MRTIVCRKSAIGEDRTVAPMGQLSDGNVGDYLVRRGLLETTDGLEVEELTGGVACTVFAVRGEGKRVVVKQALERFRVADEWLVPPERALTEARALELMARLAPGSVPRLLDSDPDAFALVMEEAPADWQPWKTLLLEGAADAAVAAWLGALLAVLHSADGDIGSAESFEAQRVDPTCARSSGGIPRSPTGSARTSSDCSARRAASSTATTRRRTSSSATTASG